MKRFSSTICGILFCALPISVGAETAGVHVPADTSRISRAWARLLDSPDLNGSVTGSIVEDVRTRQVLFARNADTRMLPASNRKLFTSAAALVALGPDFRFYTDVDSKTPVSAGTLTGDLYLKGLGDPTLGDADFDAMAKSLYAAGLRHVTGGVVGDGTTFSKELYGDNWGWNNLTDYSAPEITSLEVNRDVVDVSIVAGEREGDPTSVTIDPPIPYAQIRNQSVTGSHSAAGTKPSDDLSGFVDRIWDQNVVLVAGSVAAGTKRTDQITLVDSPRYAALEFLRALRRAGVTVDGDASSGTMDAASPTQLLHWAGIPLTKYLPLMNKPSDNLLAEALVREEGLLHGSKGDYGAGHVFELRTLKSLGIDTSTLRFNDGCGVSRRDYVPPRAIITLLVNMTKQPNWKLWYDSLPVAGVDGTLRKRMKGTRAQGNVHAKTGTLSETVCLSGYATTRNGRLLAFCLMSNNFVAPGARVRKIHDNCVKILADSNVVLGSLPDVKKTSQK